MSDLTNDEGGHALGPPDGDEPEEGDYTTADDRHFFQFGRLAVAVDEGDEWAHALKDHMDRERFWPNVWFISDHGNAHLIDMYDELAEADEKEGMRVISIKLGFCLAAGLAVMARASFASLARNGISEPRVYVYARASTKKQVDSPEIQQENATKYAAMLGLGELTFFVDAARSGKIPWEEREAGKALFEQLRPGDHVIIAKLDRAFRRLSDCVAVLEMFERLGIRLHIVNLLGGAIDLSSPMGRFLIHILAAFAELERAFISERTKDGLARRKTRNVAHTRFPGYGFRWREVSLNGTRTKVREPDDDERHVMRSILRWRAQDSPLSWKEIADRLTYQLKLKTRDGRSWDQNRVRRACQAELQLQLLEQEENG